MINLFVLPDTGGYQVYHLIAETGQRLSSGMYSTPMMALRSFNGQSAVTKKVWRDTLKSRFVIGLPSDFPHLNQDVVLQRNRQWFNNIPWRKGEASAHKTSK